MQHPTVVPENVEPNTVEFALDVNTADESTAIARAVAELAKRLDMDEVVTSASVVEPRHNVPTVGVTVETRGHVDVPTLRRQLNEHTSDIFLRGVEEGL